MLEGTWSSFASFVLFVMRIQWKERSAPQSLPFREEWKTYGHLLKALSAAEWVKRVCQSLGALTTWRERRWNTSHRWTLYHFILLMIIDNCWYAMEILSALVTWSFLYYLITWAIRFGFMSRGLNGTSKKFEIINCLFQVSNRCRFVTWIKMIWDIIEHQIRWMWWSNHQDYHAKDVKQVYSNIGYFGNFFMVICMKFNSDVGESRVRRVHGRRLAHSAGWHGMFARHVGCTSTRQGTGGTWASVEGSYVAHCQHSKGH